MQVHVETLKYCTFICSYFHRLSLLSFLVYSYTLNGENKFEIVFFSEQKVTQYEQYVRDLQAHHRAVANCQEAPNGISYQDLQQEVGILNLNFLLIKKKAAG